MDTLIKKKSVVKRSWIVKLWTRIITIGVTDELTDWEKKRTRLLNGIAAMSFIILAVYCLMYLDKEHRLTLVESFQALVAMAIVLLLNYYHRYLIACHFFNIYNIFCCIYITVRDGEKRVTKNIVDIKKMTGN